MSSDWPARTLKAWLRWSMPALQAPPPAPAADPAEEEEEEVSKLRGPSCSGTFLISMLSFLSMRGAPQLSTTGESGDEGVWPWLDSDLVDAVDALLL